MAKRNKTETVDESLLAPQAVHSVRRLIVFQVRLLADALRDMCLSPASLACAVLDLVFKKHGDSGYFEKLMNLGRHTEPLINLFETPPQLPSSDSEDQLADIRRAMDRHSDAPKNAMAEIADILAKR